MTVAPQSSEITEIVSQLLRRVDAASAVVYDRESGDAVCDIRRERVFPFAEDGDAFVVRFTPHVVWRCARGIRLDYRGQRFDVYLELPRTAPSEAPKVEAEIEEFLPRIESAVGLPEKRLARYGRYEEVRWLQGDEIGVWYEVLDPGSGGRFPARVIRDELIRDARGPFLTEARTLLGLSHPNLLRVLEIGEAPQPFLIYESRGRTLQKYLMDEPSLSLEARLPLIASFCEGLAYVHARSFVDLRFEANNVCVTENGELQIDVARAVVWRLTPKSLGLLASGAAPEQIRGQAARPASDVFTAACLFHRILTGQRPFAANTLPETLCRITSEDPPPPRSLNPQVPEAIERWLLKALDKDPSKRFQHGMALRDAWIEANRDRRRTFCG